QRELLALNILCDIDCLDEENTSNSSLGHRFAFLEHRLPETGLFKAYDFDTVLIFHVERDDDEDSFRRRVEGVGVEGIEFLPVWSSVHGPADVSLFRF
ncbi:MAG TPA: hypothetical protein VHD91_09695, partial [Gaiellaceae bacterium]|nr:hypothetical protein [Gaiellaceae bacterium]